MSGEGFAVLIWTVAAIGLGLLLAVIVSLRSAKHKGYRGKRIGK